MEKLPDLWRRYVQDGDRQARETLILHYARLVKYAVGRLGMNLPSSLQKDDLISYGVLGLMEAIDRFDPSQGVKFGTYALPRIRGQIIDSLREMDLLPRSAQRKAKQVEGAIIHLSQSLGRIPADEEVADHLQISLAQYHRWLLDANFAVISLDQPATFDGGERAPLYDLLEDTNMPKPAQRLAESEMKAELALAIEALSEREQLLISLYYQDELTMKEIGQVLGVSESRVSQMHTKVVLALRGWLNRYAEPNPITHIRREADVSVYNTST